MSQIVPFKATLPASDLVAHVTSRSYEDYSSAELASQLDYNPYSFLRILQPGYNNVGTSDPHKRWGLVKARLEDYKKEGILVEEEKAAIYLYEIKANDYHCIGFMGGFSVDAYLQNEIKKHEDTIAYRVELFEKYLHETGFNTEPVLLTYQPNSELQAIIEKISAKQPLFHFTSLNEQTHRLWRITKPKTLAKIQSHFTALGDLYIADGHHRCASAAELHMHDNQPYFLGYAVANDQLKIWEFNRVIRDLNQLSPEEFLAAIRQKATVETLSSSNWKPSKRGEFGLYLREQWYKISIDLPEFQPDAEWLYQEILHPIVNIKDLRTDARIEYLPGNKGIKPLMNWVDSGEYELAFTLFPASFKQIKHLADHHKIMPPKSTYIEPKIRSGLVLFEF